MASVTSRSRSPRGLPASLKVAPAASRSNVAGRGEHAALGEALLGAHVGQLLGLGRGLDVGAVLDDAAHADGHLGLPGELDLGRAVVVILDDVLRGDDAHRLFELVDVAALAAGPEGDLGRAADAVEPGVAVGEDHHVAAVSLLEEEADAEVLGEARDEGEVGLFVFDDGVARGVGVVEAQLEVVALHQPRRLELGADHVRHRGVEKDVARLDQAQPVGARHQHQAVRRVRRLGVEAIVGARDHPRDAAGLAAVALEDEGGLGAGELVDLEPLNVLADDDDLELEELRESPRAP